MDYDIFSDDDVKGKREWYHYVLALLVLILLGSLLMVGGYFRTEYLLIALVVTLFLGVPVYLLTSSKKKKFLGALASKFNLEMDDGIFDKSYRLEGMYKGHKIVINRYFPIGSTGPGTFLLFPRVSVFFKRSPKRGRNFSKIMKTKLSEYIVSMKTDYITSRPSLKKLGLDTSGQYLDVSDKTMPKYVSEIKTRLDKQIDIIKKLEK